ERLGVRVRGATDERARLAAEIEVVRLNGEHTDRPHTGQHFPGRFVDVGKSAARGDVAQLVLGYARTDIDESVVGVRGARTERKRRQEEKSSHGGHLRWVCWTHTQHNLVPAVARASA